MEEVSQKAPVEVSQAKTKPLDLNNLMNFVRERIYNHCPNTTQEQHNAVINDLVNYVN